MFVILLHSYFYYQFIRQNDSSTEIVEIPDENIESAEEVMDDDDDDDEDDEDDDDDDDDDIPVVCVTFERGSDVSNFVMIRFCHDN